MTGYEKPADQSGAVKEKRAAYGQKYYNKYAGAGAGGNAASTEAEKAEAVSVPFKVKIDIIDLRIRTGAGTGYAHTGEYTGKGVFTITEVKAGEGSATGWGKLLSGAGWIALDFCTRL